MNGRQGLGGMALSVAALLAGCVVRWESSPENDEYWEVSERDRPFPGSPGAGSEPPLDAGESSDALPPVTSESDYPEAQEEIASLPRGLYRDLIVLEPSIVDGPLAARDDAEAPFSFRTQMQWLAGASREPLEFTRAWLLAWENASEVGPELAPVTPRPLVRRVLVDGWLAASGSVPGSPSPESAAYGDGPGGATGDDPGAVPAGYERPSASGDPLPSWSQAPFRLIAIVNRLDLASDACSGYPGELRYVYAALDPATSETLDVTLILEVPYPSTRSAAEWARAWRELAALPEGDAYAAGLAALTGEIRAEADPLRVRLRSNEVAFSNPGDSAWEMREFQLQVQGGALVLAQVPLEFTPRADADPAELSAYVLEHSDEIEGSGVRLPEGLRAGAALIDAPDFSWSVLGVSERLRRAFSVQTCNGCHGGDTAALPFRHIGPGLTRNSPARVSRFLHDPDATSDELRRRSAVLDALVATECAAPDESGGYAGE